MSRAAEKQRSRDVDDRRLAAGEVTPDELRDENGMFAGLDVRVAWNRYLRECAREWT